MRHAIVSLLLLACASVAADPFSRSTPAEVVITHMKLDLRVSFAPRELTGRVDLQLARSAPGQRQELVLDTKDLEVETVTAAETDGRLAPLAFSLGPADPVLGSALRVTLPPGVEAVCVSAFSGPIGGTATTCSSCRPPSPTVAWRTPS